MMGSSVSSNFASWGIDNEVSDFVNHFGLQNKDVSLQANKKSVWSPAGVDALALGVGRINEPRSTSHENVRDARDE